MVEAGGRKAGMGTAKVAIVNEVHKPLIPSSTDPIRHNPCLSHTFHIFPYRWEAHWHADRFIFITTRMVQRQIESMLIDHFRVNNDMPAFESIAVANQDDVSPCKPKAILKKHFQACFVALDLRKFEGASND